MNEDISKIKFFRRLTNEWERRSVGSSRSFQVGPHRMIQLFTPLFGESFGLTGEEHFITCVENRFGGHYTDVFRLRFAKTTPLKKVLNDTWAYWVAHQVQEE